MYSHGAFCFRLLSVAAIYIWRRIINHVYVLVHNVTYLLLPCHTCHVNMFKRIKQVSRGVEQSISSFNCSFWWGICLLSMCMVILPPDGNVYLWFCDSCIRVFSYTCEPYKRSHPHLLNAVVFQLLWTDIMLSCCLCEFKVEFKALSGKSTWSLHGILVL